MCHIIYYVYIFEYSLCTIYDKGQNYKNSWHYKINTGKRGTLFVLVGIEMYLRAATWHNPLTRRHMQF